MELERSLSIKGSPLATRSHNEHNKLVVVIVGLPARGKTYISKRLARYLNWIGIGAKVFNVGDYRRRQSRYSGHEFFSENNEQAVKIRLQAALLAIEDMLTWLSISENSIAVFDATNTTRERRNILLDKCADYKVIFIESICSNEKIIYDSILEFKVKSPDYIGISPTEAVEDFLNRIQHYKKQYEPIDDKLDSHLSYVKIFNQGERYLVNNINGSLHTRMIYYLMNMRVGKRTIYITRHGESEFNVLGKLGGNSNLTSRGEQYAKALGNFMETQNIQNLKVWTSHLRRTLQTSKYIQFADKEAWKALDELDAGNCDSLTYEEVQKQFPVDFARRDTDKFNYRYPMGESYQDLVYRLESVIMELEHQTAVLLICHQAVARCLLAYFLDYSHDALPYIKVPLHQVIKLTPTAYDTMIETFNLNIDAVNTHREKPEATQIDRSDEEALKTVPTHL